VRWINALFLDVAPTCSARGSMDWHNPGHGLHQDIVCKSTPGIWHGHDNLLELFMISELPHVAT